MGCSGRDAHATRSAAPAGGARDAYEPPTIADLGTLVDLTRNSSLFFGHTANLHDMALSGVGTPPGGGTTAPTAPGSTHVTVPTPTTGTVHHHAGSHSGGSHHVSSGHHHSGGSSGSNPSSGSGTGAGTASNGGGSGTGSTVNVSSSDPGSLPFTGYSLTIVTAIGAGFSAVGAGLRRLTRAHRR